MIAYGGHLEFCGLTARARFTSLSENLFAHKATFTRFMSTDTSMSGPITSANDSPEFIPKTATVTAIANSKLLLAAVKEKGNCLRIREL